MRSIDDVALYRAEMAAWPTPGPWKEWHHRLSDWMEANEACRRDVLERQRQEGPLPIGSLPDTCVRPWRSSGSNDGKNTRMLIAQLVQRGEVAVAGRQNRERIDDLADLVYPDDPVPPLAEAEAELDRRRLRALGLARAGAIYQQGEPVGAGEAGDPAVVDAGGSSSSGSALPGAVSSSTRPPSRTADERTVIDVNSELTRLSAGKYALAPIGSSPGPLAVVDVPEGFLNDGPFLFPQREDARGEHADVSRAIGYWTVTGVYMDPCLKGSDAADPGPTAEDLAAALTAQRLTKTTHPTPITIGGHDGLPMEVTSPTDLDYGTCQSKTYDYWVSDPVGGFYTDQPGQVTRLWILDVNNQRVVIAAAFGPRVPQADIQEVTDIAESARFVHP